MDYADLSDLEEGEILEYESGSPNHSRCDDFKIKSCSIPSLKKEYKGCDFQFKGHPESEMYICEQGKCGYVNKSLNTNWKVKNIESHISMIDLESISSEEEHKSDEENKYSGGNKKYIMNSDSRSKKKKKSTQFYGTVEDIMSEIGETICRKSRCNYKKRKSKQSPHRISKYSDKSYDLWSQRIFSSHLKDKKIKRSMSFSDSDSDSDSSKDRVEKRKKKKKRKICYEGDEKSKKNSQVRDFDEMRRTLLEKLKKQKAEAEIKAANNECLPEIENSEIQEVDMLIDCTNYVDNPRDEVPEDSPEEEKEDELDLIQLRLIALASNKKQKCGETPSAEEFSEVKKSLDNNNEEVDLDRNELLLRAEALKTALLKKHQKRLNRIKVKNVESTEENNLTGGTGGSMNCVGLKGVSSNLDACKENIRGESESKEAGLNPEGTEAKNGAPSEPSGSLKETHLKTKTKRKKRKSVSFNNSLKENTDKSEICEEDDRTLRSQLLSDLLMKKSLKNTGEKSVLLETVQTSSNKPSLPAISCPPPKENEKPITVVKKTLLKKVNPPKVKPVVGSKIPKAEIQRIIVHLGSEDSSEEDESLGKASSAVGMEDNEEGEKKEGAIVKSNSKAINADYERSVELLLSQARKKIEGEKRIAEESTLATPEAVYKHLPPSQRLEYIRLKQKIAERERLRKEKIDKSASVDSIPQKTSTNGISQVPQKAAIKPVASNRVVYKSLSKPMTVLNSPSNNRVTGGLTNGVKTKDTSLRKVIFNKTKNNLEIRRGNQAPPTKEPPIQRNRLLLPSSQALISKLKLLLRKIKVEKIIEENYDREIVKLKNQLGLLEKKKNEQRFKIKKLGEESMKTYKAIQGITAKSSDRNPPKEDDGLQKEKADDGESKKSEEESKGKKVSNESETELSKEKTDRRLNNGNNASEIAGETSVGVCLLDYRSPLQVFSKVSFSSERVDPNIMMCQFDLTGVCKDEECAYQHLRTS